MKPLASVLMVIGVAASAGIAAPLEMGLGAGPSFTSLDSLNNSISAFNTLIDHLNEVFSVHPDVTGTVPSMPSIGTGLSLYASEYYRLNDWLAFGVHLEYARSASGTEGAYQGGTVSTVDLYYHAQILGIVLGGEATFVDLGLRLGAVGGLGYFYAMVDQRMLFEIPDEYPEAIAGVPPAMEGRYRGGSLGLEVGLNLSYPVVDWLAIGAQVRYRTANVRVLRDAQGDPLGLAGGEDGDSLSLHGLAVQLHFLISIDLSLDGGKETP